MKKILHISMGYTSFGGTEKMILNYIKHINGDFKMDILAPNENPFKNVEKELKKYNCDVYNLNTTRESFIDKIRYDKRATKFLKKNEYDIVHIHSSVFLFSLRIAMKSRICGIKKIVVHSHGFVKPYGIRKLIYTMLNPLYKKIVDEFLACSKHSGESLLNAKNIDKLTILKNGIEVDNFKFNNDLRCKYRKELNIDDKIVYGHAGRMCPEKNHDFLLELFYEIQKIQSNSVLLLIGTGELEENIKNKIKELDIENKVILMGFREDANIIYNCMDAFLFPSIKEGLGLVAIEAQTNGLFTFCSNNIPQEAEISPYFRRFNLTEEKTQIAQRICSENLNTSGRGEAYKYTIDHGYDIQDVCKELQDIYNR